MAERKNATDGETTLGRLSKRGEAAVNRLVDEVGKNEVVSDALARAMSAKGKLDDASKRALAQIGLAPADEVESLRKQVANLERRLAKLEDGAAAKPRATSRAKKTTGTRKTTARRPPSSGSGPTAA